MEGLCYALAAAAVSLVLGLLFSSVIVSAVASNLWFFTYQFTLMPLLATIPVLILLGLLLPLLVLSNVTKQSVVERLRENE